MESLFDSQRIKIDEIENCDESFRSMTRSNLSAVGNTAIGNIRCETSGRKMPVAEQRPNELSLRDNYRSSLLPNAVLSTEKRIGHDPR